jgi:putative SOS response-associated peptidase YedK
MCGRYIQVQKAEVIEKRFNVTVPSHLQLKPSYNISPGKYAPVITNDKPNEVQLFIFGLTPFWAQKPMYIINARAEGDRNKEDNPEYTGAKDIINKPAFRKPIRTQRCLVIADAFIEGTSKERLNKPYLVYLKNNTEPFAFAGIWDTWKNPSTGELFNSFAIITTVANSLLQKLPHHRSPVILHKNNETDWLSNESTLADITSMLKPFPSELMNAYPISSDIKNPKADGEHLIKSLSAPLIPEEEISVKTTLRLLGMGRYK